MKAAVIPFKDYKPNIEDDVFLALGAMIIGQVTLEAEVSVWYNAVLRGDVGAISVGKGSNIQDHAMLHCTTGKSICKVDDFVTVGHRAILHGCHVEHHALIGMGAIVLDNAVVGHHAIVGAGSVVLENTEIPPYTLWAGVPAKQIKTLEPDKVDDMLHASATHYTAYAAIHKENLHHE